MSKNYCRTLRNPHLIRCSTSASKRSNQRHFNWVQCPPFRLSYHGVGEPLCFTAAGPFATSAFYLIQGSTRLYIIAQSEATILLFSDFNFFCAAKIHLLLPFFFFPSFFQGNDRSHYQLCYFLITARWLHNSFNPLLQSLSSSNFLLLTYLSP